MHTKIFSVSHIILLVYLYYTLVYKQRVNSPKARGKPIAYEKPYFKVEHNIS